MPASVQNRCLALKDVKQKTTFSSASVWRGVANGTFPQPLKLSPGRTVWLESEIDHWIAGRAAERAEAPGLAGRPLSDIEETGRRRDRALAQPARAHTANPADAKVA
jgi:prophage regulatory protein